MGHSGFQLCCGMAFVSLILRDSQSGATSSKNETIVEAGTGLNWQRACLLWRKPSFVSSTAQPRCGIHIWNYSMGRWRWREENLDFVVILSYINLKASLGYMRKDKCFPGTFHLHQTELQKYQSLASVPQCHLSTVYSTLIHKHPRRPCCRHLPRKAQDSFLPIDYKKNTLEA